VQRYTVQKQPTKSRISPILATFELLDSAKINAPDIATKRGMAIDTMSVPPI
jgi:hypothetical protein